MALEHISRLTKGLFRRSQFAARGISFLLGPSGEYPVSVRRNRWLSALARNADWSQLQAYVENHGFDPPVGLVLMGSEYGDYFVPVEGPDRTWVAYSFGVGEDLDFERALIDRFHCQVHAFDPTPRAIEYAANAGGDLSEFSFHPFGVGTVDGIVRFFAPRNPQNVSYSERNIQGTEEYLDMEVRTLESIQSDLGHKRIDLLKMNIEGSELAVMEDIVDRHAEIPVIVAKLEAPVPFFRYKKALDRLITTGYQPVMANRSGLTLVHSAEWYARVGQS